MSIATSDEESDEGPSQKLTISPVMKSESEKQKYVIMTKN